MSTEKLSEALLELLENTTDFVKGEAPEVIQQYLSWGTIDAIGGFLTAVFLLVASFLLLRKWKKELGSEEFYSEPQEFGRIIGIGFAAIFCVGSLLCIYMNITIFIQIQIAPKVYLIEQILGQ